MIRCGAISTGGQFHNERRARKFSTEHLGQDPQAPEPADSWPQTPCGLVQHGSPDSAPWSALRQPQHALHKATGGPGAPMRPAQSRAQTPGLRFHQNWDSNRPWHNVTQGDTGGPPAARD